MLIALLILKLIKMKKLNFNVFPVFLTWVLGHVFLYVFLNRFLPYATINLFTAALWLGVVLFSHYNWSYTMATQVYKLSKS
jgi:hypothetical protein